jgi:hypothetical protein
VIPATNDHHGFFAFESDTTSLKHEEMIDVLLTTTTTFMYSIDKPLSISLI